MPEDSNISKFDFFQSLPNLLIFTLVISAVLVLAWVGMLTWNDISVWNKDIGTIFFGSRTGESITLGIGMKVIHYFLIGLTLLFLGLLTFLRRRNKVMKPDLGHPVEQLDPQKGPSGCSHYFGYLETLPDFDSVPQECLACKKMLECRNIRVR